MYSAPTCFGSDSIFVVCDSPPTRSQAWSPRKHQALRKKGLRRSSISLPTEVRLISYREARLKTGQLPYVAKKLKKTWVDTKKLKAKWKAEKRKESLANTIEQSSREAEEGDDAEASDHSSKAGDAIITSQKSLRPHHVARTNESQASNLNETSIRDLTKEAYSWTSLHNYKSDPLNRGRGCGRGRSRGASRGGRGRGQPNMKLRMGAMLEKIKRDYA